MKRFLKAGSLLRTPYRGLQQAATRIPPVLVLLSCVAVTIIIAIFAAVSVRREGEARFTHLSDQLAVAVRGRVVSSENLLLHIRALFMTKKNVTRGEFHDFIDALSVKDRYPGLRGVNYSVRLTEQEIPAFEKRIRAEGYPDFHFWPEPGPGDDDLYSIVYLEPPLPTIAKAIGFNSMSDAVRREAMERALKTGDPALSRPVLLMQDDDNPKRGFLLYVPVYSGEGMPATVEERQERITGFVHGLFRPDDLFGAVVGSFIERSQIDAEIYNGVILRDDDLFFSNRVFGDDPALRAFTRDIPLDIGGMHWTVRVHSLPGFEPPSARSLPWALLAAGLLMSLLLYRSSRTSERVIEEKQKLLDEARLVNRSKDDFLATLSHELRTPLGVIQGHAEVLMDSECPPGTRESIEAIHRNAKVQTRIIDDLLEVSSIITGKIRLDPRPIDIRALLDAAAEAVLFSAQAKSIGLHIHAPEELVVDADATRLQQVFWNLLSNAVKFTPPGGSIDVTVMRSGDDVAVHVKDSGQGIAPNFLPFVFDRFRQEDGSSTRRFGGLGLGLAIVQNLVQLHGGKVEAFSAGTDAGSEFIVTLPLSARAQMPATAAAASKFTGARLNGARILIVDDDNDSRGIAKKVFEQAGAHVRAVGSSREAFEVFKIFEPNLIISDIGMPDEDGYEFLRRIREEERLRAKAPVAAIALTAFAQAKDHLDSLRAGFQAHLVKPYDTHELTEIAAQLLSPLDLESPL